MEATEVTMTDVAPFFLCLIVVVLTNLFCLIWGLKLVKKDTDVETSLIG